MIRAVLGSQTRPRYAPQHDGMPASLEWFSPERYPSEVMGRS